MREVDEVIGGKEYSEESERYHSAKYIPCHRHQRKTSLFWGVKLRWTTGTLALREIPCVYVFARACVCVCASEYVRKKKNEFLFETSQAQK